MNRIVLVVEDQLEDQLLISRAVKSVCSEVTVVMTETGGEALDYICRRGPYDSRELSENPSLVIADHVLPDMFACDLVRRVREVVEAVSLPVFVYSTKIDGTVYKYWDLSIDGPMKRPDDPAEFQHAVMDAVRRHLQIVN
jgi:CheY-like chemotaxis protein